MNFLHSLWKDTLEVGNETLFTLGKTDFTLIKLAGLCLIVLAAWRLSALVRRSITKLSEHHANPSIYILSRISAYLVWILATLVGLNYLGFELSSFAFLGGAIGVGLGFGLQNILNNFVSGIIILFEKTLKVGDIVDLQSGVTGTVTEINLRYTRITTGDLMDVLVPNSEFISGHVVNWTYGELLRRIHVPFSVAYGTDKEAVREAGIAAAQSVSCTIDDGVRRPEVLLVRLGDNGLDFELVVWIGKENLAHVNSTRSRYLWALESELSRRNIEMPFPQRDLHIRNGRLTVAIEQTPR